MDKMIVILMFIAVFARGGECTVDYTTVLFMPLSMSEVDTLGKEHFGTAIELYGVCTVQEGEEVAFLRYDPTHSKVVVLEGENKGCTGMIYTRILTCDADSNWKQR